MNINRNILVICLLAVGSALADDTTEAAVEDASPAKPDGDVEKTTPGTEDIPSVVEKKDVPEKKEETEKKEEPSVVEKKDIENTSEEKKSASVAPPAETGEEKAASVENKAETPGEAGGVGKLGELLNTDAKPTEESAKEKENQSDVETKKEKINGNDDSKEKERQAPTEPSDKEISAEKMHLKNVDTTGLHASGEETPHVKKLETTDKEISAEKMHLKNVDTTGLPASGEEKSHVKKVQTADKEIAAEKIHLKNVDTTGLPATDGLPKVHSVGHNPDVKQDNTPAHHVDIPPTSAYNAGAAKAPAEHKMTPVEQNAFLCSLPKVEEELCPMTINLEENVGISDPGANAYCNDVVAAPMGYRGFCVVLMKTNPETGLPVYTKTCAYYDKEKSKCSTNFLTSQAQSNSSQVRFTCDNGLTNYIPTSCVKKSQKQHSTT